jgi:hypothetical protein
LFLVRKCLSISPSFPPFPSRVGCESGLLPVCETISDDGRACT